MQSEDLELDELWHIIIICHIRMSELYVYVLRKVGIDTILEWLCAK